MGTSSNLFYRMLVNGVKDYAIFMIDRDGIVLNWNDGAFRAKGYSESEIVGQNYEIFYSLEDRAAGLPQQNLRNALENGREALEGWRYRRNGTRFWASITIDAIYTDSGDFVGFAKITRDLTDHHELVSQLRHNATHDPLTGLLNRSGFFKRIESEMIENSAITIFAVDLDHFKPINDSFGHAAGDTVLRAVAERLAVRLNMDFVGRLGGDEFVAVRCMKVDPAATVAIGLSIIKAIGMPIQVGDQQLTVGASVGMAYATADTGNVDMFLARADIALYNAKISGRDAAYLFEDESDTYPKSLRYRYQWPS